MKTTISVLMASIAVLFSVSATATTIGLLTQDGKCNFLADADANCQTTTNIAGTACTSLSQGLSFDISDCDGQTVTGSLTVAAVETFEITFTDAQGETCMGEVYLSEYTPSNTTSCNPVYAGQ